MSLSITLMISFLTFSSHVLTVIMCFMVVSPSRCLGYSADSKLLLIISIATCACRSLNVVFRMRMFVASTVLFFSKSHVISLISSSASPMVVSSAKEYIMLFRTTSRCEHASMISFMIISLSGVVASLAVRSPGCGVLWYRCNVPRALHLLARGNYNLKALSTAVRVEIFPVGKNTTRPFTTL